MMAFKLLVRGQGLFDNFLAFESVYNLMFGLTELDFFTEYGVGFFHGRREQRSIDRGEDLYDVFFVDADRDVEHVDRDHGRLVRQRARESEDPIVPCARVCARTC